MPAWQPPTTSEGAIGGGAGRAGSVAAPSGRRGGLLAVLAVAAVGSIHQLRAGESSASRSTVALHVRPGRDGAGIGARIASGVLRRGADSHSPDREAPGPRPGCCGGSRRRPRLRIRWPRFRRRLHHRSLGRSRLVRDVGRPPPPRDPRRGGGAERGRRLVVLGGGQVSSYAGIAAFDPATGGVRIVGRLPTPLSDLSVATVGRTTYAVGGFTGAAWSDGIVAIDAGRARRVARLPIGLRYAAVAAVGNAILIAGGRTEAGPSRAIYRFTPADGSVARIGTLPQPLMHASAGALGGTMYVVGGIGAAGAPVTSVLAVDAGGGVHRAATLPGPLSDAGVASLPGRLLVIGGSDGSGPTRAVLSISATGVPVPRPHPASRHAGLPRRFRGPLPGDL